MKRIVLFLATNFLVILAISLIVNLLGLRPYLTTRGVDYGALLSFCAVWGFAGSIISLLMSRFMAKMALGVRLIDPEDPAQARLVNMVRRLCEQAGLRQLPEIGIYESPEVNAFATGPSRSRALLAISSGLLAAMDARAVEGVLGHEISHIVNGDMVTMTLVQGVVNTFVMFFAYAITFVIDQALRDREGRERGGGLGYFSRYLLIQLLETVLFLLASPLIYWFSRLREYRADSGSAGLAGRDTMIHALEQLRSTTQIQDNRAPSLSSFKINGHGRGLLALLYSTHPPLEARIEALKRLPAGGRSPLS